jgi:hypothetical protein
MKQRKERKEEKAKETIIPHWEVPTIEESKTRN